MRVKNFAAASNAYNIRHSVWSGSDIRSLDPGHHLHLARLP